MPFADSIASLKSKAQKKAGTVRKRIAEAVELGAKSLENAGHAPVPEFMSGDQDIVKAFRQYAGQHLQDAKSGALDFVETLLTGPQDMADTLRLAGLIEHLLQEGRDVLDDGISGVPRVLHGNSMLNAVQGLKSQARIPERQKFIDDTLDRFRNKGSAAAGLLLERVANASLPILRGASKELAGSGDHTVLAFLGHDPSPIASQMDAIRDRFDSFSKVIGEPAKPADMKLDIEALEELLWEIAPVAHSAAELVVDNVASFTHEVGDALSNVLFHEIDVPGVSEMYRFATATRGQPKGRSLTVASAFCFAAAHKIVSDLKKHSIPMPLDSRQIETVTRMKFRELAPDWDDVAGIVNAASQPIGENAREGAKGEAPEPVIDESIVTGVQIVVSMFDIQLKTVIAIAGTGLSKEDQVSLGLVCNAFSLLAGPFQGPLLETVNMFGYVADDALPKGGTAGIVALVFEWIAWVIAAFTWLYKVVVQRLEKVVSPFVVTVLAVMRALSSLCSAIAGTVRNAMAGENMALKESVLVVSYLAELCGFLPEVFEFCKSAITATATEGTSLAIELVVERVLPWAEVSLASLSTSLKFGELVFLSPQA